MILRNPTLAFDRARTLEAGVVGSLCDAMNKGTVMVGWGVGARDAQLSF